MKFVNYFSSNARQWDKIAIECRLGGLTLLEIKGDVVRLIVGGKLVGIITYQKI